MSSQVTAIDWAVAAARSIVEPAAGQAEALAASAGVAVTVKARVFVDDGSKHWATVLAETLCANPELAQGNRQRMADMLVASMQLGTFTANRLSKPLSTGQKERVAAILDSHGYDTSTLTTGLSIRDIVKGNIRAGSARPATVSTKFYADHIEIDGVSFQYRPRERTPMGTAENDFCIRVAGVDVPLMAVLRLRNIGLGEFRIADKRAMKSADAAQKRNREQIGREYVEPPQINRLYNELQRATRDSDKAQREARERYLDIWSHTGGLGRRIIGECARTSKPGHTCITSDCGGREK